MAEASARSPSRPPTSRSTVAEILADVRERGDDAVLELTRRFDGEVAAPCA